MTLKKYIPDSITSLNLLCGTVGVVFALNGRLDIAFYFMLAGAVFDFFDGFAARLLGAYSDMGKELDSLADVVSFGVLPSVMLHKLMQQCSFSSSVWCWIPLLIAVFSGLRLAKFNVDPRQGSSFIGLPTPACAMICGALCHFVASSPAGFLCSLVSGDWFVPVLSVVLSFLLVCEIPMFSMKFHSDDPKSLKIKRICFAVNCVLCVLIVVLTAQCWSLSMFFAFIVYVAMNIVFALLKI